MNDETDLEQVKKQYKQIILREEEIRQQIICTEINQDTNHLFNSKYITDHLVLAVFLHRKNPFSNKIFSYVPIWPCLHDSNQDYYRIMVMSKVDDTKLGKALGYRLWDHDIGEIKGLTKTIYRKSVIINNPASKKHLNYSYRKWLKTKLDSKLINYARKHPKYKFTEEFPDDGDLWSLANKTLDTIEEAIIVKKDILKQYTSEKTKPVEAGLEAWA